MHLYKFLTISFWIGYIHLIYHEDGGNGFLRHVGKCLLYYTASHPVRQHFSVSSVRITVY